MQRARLRGGLEAPLLVERTPCRLVGVERLLLAARPGEGEHQETAEPLAVGVLRGEGGSVGDHVVVAAELDLGLDAVLERGEPELVEPRDLRLEEALVREVGERRAAPERERVPERGGALRGRKRPRVVHEPLEATSVDRTRLRPKHVPGRARLDRLFPDQHPQPRGRRSARRPPPSAAARPPTDRRSAYPSRRPSRRAARDRRARRAVSGHRAKSAPGPRAPRAGRARETQRRRSSWSSAATLLLGLAEVQGTRLADRWRDTTAFGKRHREDGHDTTRDDAARHARGARPDPEPPVRADDRRVEAERPCRASRRRASPPRRRSGTRCAPGSPAGSSSTSPARRRSTRWCASTGRHRDRGANRSSSAARARSGTRSSSSTSPSRRATSCSSRSGRPSRARDASSSASSCVADAGPGREALTLPPA